MAGSSSYPRSTTAWRWARVTESRVANNVTSHPRDTSPSAMLPATVSHAPYCRGGVRQATGDSTATLFCCIVMLLHGGQHFREWSGCETRGVIGQTVGNDQLAVVDQSAAGIHHIGNI